MLKKLLFFIQGYHPLVEMKFKYNNKFPGIIITFIIKGAI